MFRFCRAAFACVAAIVSVGAAAQAVSGTPAGRTPPTTAPSAATSPNADARISELESEVDELKQLVQQLQAQVSQLAPGAPAGTVAAAGPAASGAAASTGAGSAASGAPAPPGATSAAAPGAASVATAGALSAADVLRGFTINALLDGYYEYNANSSVGRINNLRAYDVSSDSFSLNQADIVLESAVDVAAGKRYGMRLDLQFGQATSTLQGNSVNELRPDVYRNIYQAYGTYVFPVAGGLTMDFGKWASSLGIEGNYTKDQLNYSRSFWFDYLPFYHTGIRAKLAVDDQVAFNVWITNGTNQTEAFNNYKDQLYGVVVTPTPTTSWTLNYYRGQEHPDVVYLADQPAGQTLPTQQGTYVMPIADAPNGKLDIIDSYGSWTGVKDLTLAAELDYVQERLYSHSSPQRVEGGALYAGYQLSSMLAVAARAEYLADIGGLFSGTTQYLKEETLTFDYRPAAEFLLRAEYRRDHSNQNYFLSHTLGDFVASQPTVGLGLVWWFGQKTGAW